LIKTAKGRVKKRNRYLEIKSMDPLMPPGEKKLKIKPIPIGISRIRTYRFSVKKSFRPYIIK
jgi:hypothetical protein